MTEVVADLGTGRTRCCRACIARKRGSVRSFWCHVPPEDRTLQRPTKHDQPRANRDEVDL